MLGRRARLWGRKAQKIFEQAMIVKFWGVAAGVALSIALIGYLFWRPSQAPLLIGPSQERAIVDLEAAKEKAGQEREAAKKAAREATLKAGQAEMEAARLRGQLRELEAKMEQIQAKRGAEILTPDDAIKDLKSMGWLKDG